MAITLGDVSNGKWLRSFNLKNKKAARNGSF